MYLTLTQIRIKYVVLVRPHVLVRISQSNTRSNTVQIHQIRTVLHRISTFRLLLLGDTSDDSVPPLYMSTDTREYCINMPYSSTCQIRIKYTSNTQSNTSKYGCTWRTTPVVRTPSSDVCKLKGLVPCCSDQGVA